MAKLHGGGKGTKGTGNKAIKIPLDIIKDMESKPDIKSYKREPTEIELEVIRRYLGLKSLNSIGEVLGISKTLVSDWAKKYNIERNLP